MNILDHIKAGHYPRDSQGRQVVQRAHGHSSVTILSTEGRFSPPIIAINFSGEIQGYDEDGNYKGTIGIPFSNTSGRLILLPPEPDLQVTGFVIYDHDIKEFVSVVFNTRTEAENELDLDDKAEVIVEVSGKTYSR